VAGANRLDPSGWADEPLFKLVDEMYEQSKFRYVRYDQRKQKADK
jgi:hypothetical protein